MYYQRVRKIVDIVDRALRPSRWETAWNQNATGTGWREEIASDQFQNSVSVSVSRSHDDNV